MSGLPEHHQAALRELIKRGYPAEQIAFMMNMSLEGVEEAIARARRDETVNTTERDGEGEREPERTNER
jgi:DNA-directed RNA polymerase specialized sigma24 family protein